MGYMFTLLHMHMVFLCECVKSLLFADYVNGDKILFSGFLVNKRFNFISDCFYHALPASQNPLGFWSGCWQTLNFQNMA